VSVRQLDDLRNLMRVYRKHHCIGHMLAPAVNRKRSRNSSTVEARGGVGEDALAGEDRKQLVEYRVGQRYCRHD
jgi:hypothetical protein